MRVTDIYDDVLTILERLGVPAIKQRVFFVYLNQAIGEILTMYPDNAIEGNGEQPRIDELTDGIYLKNEFFDAIVSDIVFLSGGGDEWQSRFMRSAQLVSENLNKHTGKRIRKRR